MTPRLHSLLLALAALLVAACGNSIGDSCSLPSDCSSDGTRMCDSRSPGGYCTIEGCDYGTCPEEAVCVRFYPLPQLTVACEVTTDCAIDELCVSGLCAPVSTEKRFCMLKCSAHGDCRGNYECRDVERQTAHGGQPVPAPDGTESTQAFCAASHPCTQDSDCDLGDTCDRVAGYCKAS